jgi:hypothetical protein
MFLPRPLALLFRQVMTTILSLTMYKYKILLIMIRDIIILFVPAYVGSSDTPDSTIEDQTGGYDNFISLDDIDFDFLHGVLTQDKLRGPQLGGTPPMWTQEELPGARPTGTQVSGGTQLSPGGLPGSSHQVAWLVAAMATPQAAADARRRQFHPRGPLMYPRSRRGPQPKQTSCTRRPGVARLGRILFRQQNSYL